MKTFFRFLVAHLRMLLRNRVLIVSSLGLALISIFVFGWLFGGQGNFKIQLGIANSDTSTASAQIIDQLKQSASVTVFTGAAGNEVQALRNGQRDAVLVLGSDFGASMAQGHAQIQVYFNQSNPTTLAVTLEAVQSIIARLNEAATGKPLPVSLVEQPISVHNLRQIDFIAPGMLGVMLMWANLSVAAVLVGWRQQGIIKRLAATPLRSATLIGSQLVSRLLLSLAQAAVLLAVAIAVFQVQIIGNLAVLAMTLVLGTLSMLAIGYAIGSFAKNQEVAQAITLIITFPMMFLSGSYFSTDNAPPTLQPIINTLPLTHLNDALRQIINNGATLASIQNDLLILAAWVVAGLLLATRAFRWN